MVVYERKKHYVSRFMQKPMSLRCKHLHFHAFYYNALQKENQEDKQIFEEFGYEDKLLVTGEPFALWVIESKRDISGELPFEKAGLPLSSPIITSPTSSARYASSTVRTPPLYWLHTLPEMTM